MQRRYLLKGSQLGVSLVLAGLLSACASTGAFSSDSGSTRVNKSLDQAAIQALQEPVNTATSTSPFTHPTPGIPPSSSLTTAQQAQVASIVQSTLMNNPQILVDVVNKLHQQQLAAAQQAAISVIAKNAAVLIGTFISPSIGASNAKTVVIEFMDYQCSYCHQDYPVVKALIAAHPEVKFVFKEFPVFGASSTYAAGMAIAAEQQGKFEAYHNALFDTGLMEGQLTNKAVDQVAVKVGINLTQAKAFISTSSVTQELAKNQSLASQLGIQGTPDFIVMPNSASPDPSKITFLPGAVSGSVLENAINQAQ